MNDTQSVGTLELELGNIAQLSANDGVNDLVITTYLGFFGGTLNSTANASVVHITGSGGSGATANLQPLLSPTLTIGSTISLEGLGYAGGGAGMAIFAGNYFFTNDADDIVGVYCAQEIKKKDLWTINDPD